MKSCYNKNERGTRGTVGNVLDFNIVVRGFELQSRNYLDFRTYTWEMFDPLNPYCATRMTWAINDPQKG